MKKILTVLFLFCTMLMVRGDNVSASYIDSISHTTPGNYSLFVDQFDPALGTLLGAKFTLEGMVTHSISVTDGTPSGQTTKVTWDKLNLYTEYPGYFTPLDRYFFELTGPQLMAIGSSFVGNIVTNAPVPDGGTATFNATELSGFGSFSFSGDDLSPLIGSGVVEFLFSASADGDSISLTGGNNSMVQSPSLFGQVAVEYDFAPVPLPGAVWLLASGLVGLVGLRKRFQK